MGATAFTPVQDEPGTTPAAHVRLTGVSKAFGPTRAVSGATLSLAAGELFTLLGPSGCGKTTLLRLIAGFERPDEGEICVGGELVAGRGEWAAPERRRIGMVFQDYALFPQLTVEENVAFGLPRGERRPRARVRSSRLRAALDLVGLQHKSNCLPQDLSGGERQRVALARALCPEPQLVLLDEPFSSLDASLRADLRREVEVILRDAGTTALLVTHDQEEALSLADRIGVMRAGTILQVGPPEEVYRRPADRWAAGFLGEVNVLSGVVRGAAIQTWLGEFRTPPGEQVSGSVQLAVRPEHLELRLDEGGNAHVLDRDFRGHDVLYRLRHESGRSLLVQLPSLELFEVGSRVYVRPAGAAAGTLVG